MSRTFIRLVVLSCIVLSTGCDDHAAAGAPQGNTEVDILISAPGSQPDELVISIDFLSYRIACPSSGLAPYDDSIEMYGTFEIDETQSTPVWQFVTDLPPSICTIALWVFYDDEVVCSGSESKQIVEDGDPSTTNKFSINLACTLSANTATGDLDIDTDFNEVHGNYCPQLVWLGSTPPTITPGGPAVINVQTSSFDLDGICGDNCDPQACDFGTVPPTCMPGPDLGLISTLVASAGTFADANAFDTTYTCDPLAPGPIEICVTATDGDLECDQSRCITVQCPDLCAGVDCDDANECTRDHCDPLTGLCANDDAPDGIACDNCASTCQAGSCDAGTPFSSTNNAAVMTISGAFQTLSTSVENPYSGETVPLSGPYFVNNSSYGGPGADDLLIGTTFSDVLFVYDLAGSPPQPPQRVCGVETIRAYTGFDVMVLADEYIVLGNMDIQGGDADDLLWANAGDDIVRGLDGDDRIDGGPGDDTVEGGIGDDTIALWPGSGFDSVTGGAGSDQVRIDATQNQVEISPAADPSYEFDILYLGAPMAQIREVEIVVMNDTFVDLATCVGGVCDFCGNDLLNPGEECDDGNAVNGDGCADDCTSEY